MLRLSIFAIFICIISAVAQAQTYDNIGSKLLDEQDSLYRKHYPKAILETNNNTTPTILPNINRNSAHISNPTIPLNDIPDKSLYIGEIEINSETTATGGKTYDIPIKLPCGMHGFQPNISVGYNSQRRNAAFGIGWDIEGDSKITRGSHSLYYDGYTQGVTNTQDDAFYLDGNRLLRINENLASNDIWYETEIGNIKAKLNSNLREFTVYYANGSTGIFNSLSGNYNSPHFYLCEFRDIWDNTILYDRFATGMIKKIKYNGNTIDFEYEPRKNPTMDYLGGRTVWYNELISKIKVWVDNSLLIRI